MAGIKETKEVILAVKSLAVLLTKQFKDGFQPDDIQQIIAGLIADPAFMKAIEGIKDIPLEIVDIDAQEGVELAQEGLQIVFEIIGALKE